MQQYDTAVFQIFSELSFFQIRETDTDIFMVIQ